MATVNQEEDIRNPAGHGAPIGEQTPITAPRSINLYALLGDESDHSSGHYQASEPANTKETDLAYPKNDVPAIEEDQMRTPKLERPPSVIESLASRLSEPVHNRDHQPHRGNGEANIVVPRHPDYFNQKVPQESVVADISRTPSSSNVSSTGLSGFTNSLLDTSSTPVSPENPASTWKDYVPSYNPESNRPVSVPNFQTKSLSRRREGPEYPNYPDQSFKALQDPHYPPPYQPGEAHYLRTRSSHPSQNSSYTSSGESSVRSYPPVPSGAKTVGNTPAQSPGLFTPILSKKHWTGEPGETRQGTPLLHPAHLQEPKE